MKRQRGVTLTGMILVCVLLVVVLLVGFKLVPVYVEYNTIKKDFDAMAHDPALQKASVPEMRRAWDSRSIVNNTQSVTASDIDFRRDGGAWVISADYSVKVPLFRGVSACFDFHPTSN